MQNELELAEQSQKNKKDQRDEDGTARTFLGAAWWEAGIDPIAIARKLWERTLEAEARKPATQPHEALGSEAPDRVSPSDGAGNAPA
jgi:hypothetical protein